MSDTRTYSRNFLTEFIELYKSLPALWKIKSKEYSNRVKKNEAYRLLVEKFKEVEPDATRDTVTKKINSLRSSRRKEKKKVEDSLKSSSSAVDIYHPTLWYYDLLGFVDDQEATRIIFVDSVESEDNTDAPSETESLENGDEASTSVHIPYRPSSRRSSCNLRSQLNEDGKKLSTRKRGRELEDTKPFIGKSLIESAKEDHEGHDAFGRHVAHKLRKLPSDQRIFLEKIINDAIFEAELGNLSRNCYLHVPACSTVLKYDCQSP